MKLPGVFVPAAEGDLPRWWKRSRRDFEGETIEEAPASLTDALRMLLECSRELA